MIATALALAALLAAPPPAEAPTGPAPESLEALAASVAEASHGAGAERAGGLDALRRPLHAVVLAPRTAYDPVKKLLRVRLPDGVARAAAAAGGLREVLVLRLAPVDPALTAVLEAGATPAEAPALADDVRLRVTFRLAPVNGAKDGALLQVARAAHVPTLHEPWEGAVETRTLGADLVRVELFRASTGSALAHLQAGEPPPAPAGEDRRAPVRTRKAVDHYGRAGAAWTMKAQHAYTEVCKERNAWDPDALGVARRCRCMLEATQVRHPRSPPVAVEPAEEADLRAQCNPRPEVARSPAP